MTHSVTLSILQVVSLTDAAIVVIDVGSETVRFASARALDLLDVPSGAREDQAFSIMDVLDPDEGRLHRFLTDAGTMGSPLVAPLRRKKDGARLIGKGHRVTSPEGLPWVIVKLTGDTELSRRFRLLAEKINALNHEIDSRKTAEDLLSRNAVALERTLIGVRQISEIDTSDPDYLRLALVSFVAAIESHGAMVIGIEAGRKRVLAAVGGLADLFEVQAPLCLPTSLGQLWEMPLLDRVETMRAALQESARGRPDLSGISALPLFVGATPKAWLVLTEPSAYGNETEILSEALASLMSRAAVEMTLRHAQKLQAIGELTGGIAHDFNNILAVVLGNAELLLDQAAPSDPMSTEVELANEIRDGALRGATLVSRLLSFARKQPLRPQSLSLNTVLRDLDKLLRRAIGSNINIEFIAAGGLWKTQVDPSQFENAVLNLALNARDAMPDGGNLIIETANTRLDAEYADQHTEVKPGQYAMVAVSDTGSGMPPDVIREAFTPYFTTKGVGQGSGLGLSMVFGFVKQSGGHIKIYSEPGHGTVVKMYFPRDLQAPGAEHGAFVAPAERMPKAHGHILLVEDDPAILLYAERTLAILGYTVDTALNGDAAADLLRAQTYDILLTDVVLPGGLNGAQLAQLASEISPGIKVLFMSGYTENAIVHNGRLDADVELISKPFTREQLARRLANLTKS